VVAANAPKLYTSTDGRNWAEVDLADASVTLAAAAYGNGRFVVVTDNNHYASPDGIAWTRRPALGITGHRLRFANGVFHLSGRATDGRNMIWSSTDGESWIPIFTTAVVTRIGGAAVAGGRTVIADGLGQIRYRAWTGELRDTLPGPGKLVTGMTAVDGALHAVTDWGEILRSGDGRAWETVAELPAGFRGIAQGNGRFVAASDAGARSLYTSPDGRNWAAADDGSTFPRMSSVAYGNGIFVSCGSFGEVLRSAGGQTWQLIRTPVRVELTGVAYGAGQFVAVSIQGSALTSTDGLVWTEVHSAMGRMTGICHGTQGFVAVGGWGVAPGFIWTSPNGRDWTPRADSATPSLLAVCHGNGRYLASGHNGAVLLSDDGLTWQRRILGVFPHLQAVAVFGSRLVVAGAGGAVVLSEQ
jgi:putative intracellular protease/amidase